MRDGGSCGRIRSLSVVMYACVTVVILVGRLRNSNEKSSSSCPMQSTITIIRILNQIQTPKKRIMFSPNSQLQCLVISLFLCLRKRNVSLPLIMLEIVIIRTRRMTSRILCTRTPTSKMRLGGSWVLPMPYRRTVILFEIVATDTWT